MGAFLPKHVSSALAFHHEDSTLGILLTEVRIYAVENNK